MSILRDHHASAFLVSVIQAGCGSESASDGRHADTGAFFVTYVSFVPGQILTVSTHRCRGRSSFVTFVSFVVHRDAASQGQGVQGQLSYMVRENERNECDEKRVAPRDDMLALAHIG